MTQNATNEPGSRNARGTLAGLALSPRSVRRRYVVSIVSVISLLYILCLWRYSNYYLTVIFATCIFWFPQPGGSPRLWPVLDVPRAIEERKPETYLLLLRCYRTITIVWIVMGLLFTSLAWSEPTRSQTLWHQPVALTLWAVVIFSVNLPKAALLWSTQS